MNTAVEGHTTSTELTSCPAEPRRKIGLSALDTITLTSFVKGEPATVADLIEDTRLLAQALVEDDQARTRMAARACAAARTQQRILEALLGDRLAARDEAGVAMVSKALDGVTKRISVWMKALQVEASLRRRPVVLINHADQVKVG